MENLLIVTPKYPPQPGGASYVFSLVSEHLVNKIGITVITSTERGFIKIEKRRGVKIFRLFPYFESKAAKIIALPFTLLIVFTFFLLNQRKFNIVETHTVGELCLFSQLFSKKFRKKLIKHILDMSAPAFLLRHPMPDRFINCGSVITNKLRKAGIPREIIDEINLPIPYIANKKYKKKGKRILLFVGEISKRKGIHDILAAVKAIEKQNFEIWFIGSGPLVDEVKQAAKSDKRIKYLGLLSHEKVIELMKKTDIILHPTYADVMPLTILEGMMLGNAVLSTNIGEIKKNVANAGIIINPGDRRALKTAMKTLLSRDLTNMKKNAIKNFSHYAEQDVYQENLNSVRKALK